MKMTSKIKPERYRGRDIKRGCAYVQLSPFKGRDIASMKIPKTYWCVKTVVQNDGTREVFLFGRDCDEKPKDTCLSNQEKNLSKKWFDNKEEAESFFECNKINKPPLPKSLPETEIRLLTPRQVAKMLNVSYSTVADMANKNEIRAHRIRGSIRFDPADVEHYIFLTKNSYPPFQFNPSCKEELFQRMDNRHWQEKDYLEKLITKAAKDQKKRLSQK